MDVRVNTQKYQNILDENFLSFITIAAADGIRIQQDNAPIHAVASTKTFFEDDKIKLLKWAALSFDLNPIENLWAILSRNVGIRPHAT